MSSKIVHVGDIADQIRGVTYDKSEASDEPKIGYIPILRANNITENGLSLKDFVYVPQARVTSKQYLRQGDIVIAASSGSLDVVGKAAPLTSNFTGSFGAFCKVVRPGNEIDPGYLSHFFRTQEYRRKISELAAGVNINNLRNEHIDNLEIPLPPLDDQRRIAAILDQADALRYVRRRAIERLNDLEQAMFYEMFGDPATNPKGWDMAKLGDLCDVGSSKRVFVSDFVNKGVPFYRGTEIGKLGAGENIEPDLFISLEHYSELINHSGKPKIGDLLLPSICHDGRIWKVNSEEPFYFKDGRVLWIKSNEHAINSEYLRKHLQNVFLQNYTSIASGTTFAELKIVNLKNLFILCPPIELQIEFSSRITEIAIRHSKLRRSEIALEALFVSLQHRAFRGEL